MSLDSFHAVAGVLAGALSLCALGAYGHDIIVGHTRPSRVTWWVLGALNVALTYSYSGMGARSTLWLPASYAVVFLTVGCLSLKYGEGTWSLADVLCATGAALGIIALALFHSPGATLLWLVLTEFAALIPTLLKAYRRPWTEDRKAWGLATAAALVNVAAIDRWVPGVALYPLFVLATNALALMLLKPWAPAVGPPS